MEMRVGRRGRKRKRRRVLYTTCGRVPTLVVKMGVPEFLRHDVGSGGVETEFFKVVEAAAI